MPTAFEFDVAARTLRGVSEDLAGLTAPAERMLADGVIAGGALTVSVGGLVADDADGSRVAASEAEHLADICAFRAEVCRTYAADVAARHRDLRVWRSEVEAHRRHVDAFEAGLTNQPPGRSPRRPSPPSDPPAWVDT